MGIVKRREWKSTGCHEAKALGEEEEAQRRVKEAQRRVRSMKDVSGDGFECATRNCLDAGGCPAAGHFILLVQNTSNQTKRHPAAPALRATFGLTAKLGGCATRPSGAQNRALPRSSNSARLHPNLTVKPKRCRRGFGFCGRGLALLPLSLALSPLGRGNGVVGLL